MKKIFTILLATTTLFCSCSTDDAKVVTPVEVIPPTEKPQQPPTYKMFISYCTTPNSINDITLKTKTGNGDWIVQEIKSWYINVQSNDSLHLSSNGNYIPDRYNSIGFEVMNVLPSSSDLNYNFNVSLYSMPIERKLKLDFK